MHVAYIATSTDLFHFDLSVYYNFTQNILKSLYSEHNARGRKFAVCWCLVILLIILAVSILIFIAAVSLIVYFHSIDTKQHVTYDTFFDADSPYNKLCHNSYVFNRFFEVLISVGMMCCMPGACFTCASTGFSLFSYNVEQVTVY